MKSLMLIFCLVSGCMCQDAMVDDPEYVLNMDSPIYVCPDDDSQDFVDMSEIEVLRYNESTAYMSGVMKLLKTVDRKTVVQMLIEKETSGRHDLIASVEICDFCDEFENPDSIYAAYFKHFGFPEKCPVEARVYSVDNFVADTSELPINSANVGRYQATINVYDDPSGLCKQDKIFLACLKMDLVIEPI